VTATIRAPRSMIAKLRNLMDREGIDLEVMERGGDVRVVIRGGDSECDVKTLRMGGRVSCVVARAMAKRLQVSSRTVGRLMNLLDIKICSCELGCFS
jgi:hypothetical protein